MPRINEIFQSLQGEGHHAGVPSVFIRFSGCNLRCPFCDTDHAAYALMTNEEIAAEACRYNAPWVILTGGEPSLQAEQELVDLLHQNGKKVAIETNGTHPLPPGIDWITLSPKTGICGEADLPLRIDRADEIKVVDTGQPLDPYFSLGCRTPRTLMYLQPCFVADEKERQANIRRTVERAIADPRWTLSAQLHRFLNIP